ncbi:hypothetical protein Msil_0051 [Methylocella silvestris BL2]|uniref:Uncharacterized protein n=1 Tax=Methylocella silvestris (strain DSM 15510 / CIP 108128 / LMG 27833 / NCIMB 13906 / BL2) TaxID=395965 RepID=B8EL39_METSB|nr:hypothetical protein Msil_0051 [Methylocella silvestris BL2]
MRESLDHLFKQRPFVAAALISTKMIDKRLRPTQLSPRVKAAVGLGGDLQAQTNAMPLDLIKATHHCLREKALKGILGRHKRCQLLSSSVEFGCASTDVRHTPFGQPIEPGRSLEYALCLAKPLVHAESIAAWEKA